MKPLTLTVEQRALFDGFAPIIPRIASSPRWAFLRCRLGQDAVEQEARIAAVREAGRYRPECGHSFQVCARTTVRHHLGSLQKKLAGKGCVWREMPTAADDAESQLDPADHRTDEAQAASRRLSAWLDPDYCEQRGCLDWTERLLLYLRTVEGLTITEAGKCFGLSGTRARYVEEEAGSKLAAFRVRRRREAEHHQHTGADQ